MTQNDPQGLTCHVMSRVDMSLNPNTTTLEVPQMNTICFCKEIRNISGEVDLTPPPSSNSSLGFAIDQEKSGKS